MYLYLTCVQKSGALVGVIALLIGVCDAGFRWVLPFQIQRKDHCDVSCAFLFLCCTLD
jgi:hypothetical protein